MDSVSPTVTMVFVTVNVFLTVGGVDVVLSRPLKRPKQNEMTEGVIPEMLRER